MQPQHRKFFVNLILFYSLKSKRCVTLTLQICIFFKCFSQFNHIQIYNLLIHQKEQRYITEGIKLQRNLFQNEQFWPSFNAKMNYPEILLTRMSSKSVPRSTLRNSWSQGSISSVRFSLFSSSSGGGGSSLCISVHWITLINGSL